MCVFSGRVNLVKVDSGRVNLVKVDFALNAILFVIVLAYVIAI